jgi:hypothetical protein
VEVGRPGRFVRIWKGNHDHLTLPEVFVWAPAGSARVNVAAGRAAFAPAATTFQAYFPEYAVNGAAYDTWNTTGGIFHSTATSDAYWQVDLGKVQPVSAIDISSRFDCCPEQLIRYFVFASDQPFASESLAATLADSKVSVWYVSNFLPVNRVAIGKQARYIRLQKSVSEAIVFTEVQVWSQERNVKVFALPDDPPATSSTQSSQHFDFATAYRSGRAPVRVVLK